MTCTEDCHRALKVPALNIVHVCGVLHADPREGGTSDTTPESSFELIVRSYRVNRKAKSAIVSVHCFGQLAEAVCSHLHRGSVVLITGELHRPSDSLTVSILATAIQFLDSEAKTQGR